MSADIDLIRAMFAALKAAPSVSDLVGERIYDRAPEIGGKPTAGYPYISLGATTVSPEDFDCVDSDEMVVQLDVWTSGSGAAYSSVQCRQLSNAVRRVLHNAELDLGDTALVTLRCELIRILDDPNPAIHHGALQFAATVETP